MKKTCNLLFAKLLQTLFVLLLVSCAADQSSIKSTSDQNSNISGSVQESHNYRALTVEPQDIKLKVVSFGVIDSLEKHSIYSKVSGEVMQKVVSDGDFLNKGDAIVLINKDFKDIELQSVLALMKQREIEYDAAKELRNSGNISEAKLMSALAGFKNAESDYNNLLKQIDRYTVTAPISGFIGKILVSQGDIVSSGVNLITEITALDSHIAKFDVSARDIPRLVKGAEAEIEIAGLGECQGIVRYISRSSSAHDQTFSAEVALDSKCTREKFIPLGSMVRVSVSCGSKKAYRVPNSSFVVSGDGALAIKIIRSNKVELLQVEMLEDDSQYALIAQEKYPGEKLKVIFLGSDLVQEGQKIN